MESPALGPQASSGWALINALRGGNHTALINQSTSTYSNVSSTLADTDVTTSILNSHDLFQTRDAYQYTQESHHNQAPPTPLGFAGASDRDGQWMSYSLDQESFRQDTLQYGSTEVSGARTTIFDGYDHLEGNGRIFEPVAETSNSLNTRSLEDWNRQLAYHRSHLFSVFDQVLSSQARNEPMLNNTSYLIPWPSHPTNVPAPLPANAQHSSLAYFLSDGIVYCFDQENLELFELINTEARDRYLPVQGVSTPVPPAFKINSTWYMRTISAGRVLLQVYDRLSGTWGPVTLFDNPAQANLVRPRTGNVFAARRDLFELETSEVEPDYVGEVEHQSIPFETTSQGDLNQAITLNSASYTAYSSISGSPPGSYELALPSTNRSSVQSQLPMEPLFCLSLDAGKAEVDEHCTKFTRGGYQDIFCPFCHRRQGRVSNLKRHLYFSLGIKPYLCAEGCGWRFETRANELRHSKSCDGSSRGHLSRHKSGRAPHCRHSNNSSLATSSTFNNRSRSAGTDVC